jgi:hypothetical protein
MKKKIIFGSVILSIVALSVINVNFGSQNNQFSSVSLANVEALAEESVNKYETVTCVDGSYIDPFTGREMLTKMKFCEGNGEKDCSCS